MPYSFWGCKWFQSCPQGFLVISECLTSPEDTFPALHHHSLFIRNINVVNTSPGTTLAVPLPSSTVCIHGAPGGRAPNLDAEVSAHIQHCPFVEPMASGAWTCPVQPSRAGAEPGQSLMAGEGRQPTPAVFAQRFILSQFLLIVNQEGPISPPKNTLAWKRHKGIFVSWLKLVRQRVGSGGEVLEKQHADFSCGLGMGAHQLTPQLPCTWCCFLTQQRGAAPPPAPLQRNGAKAKGNFPGRAILRASPPALAARATPLCSTLAAPHQPPSASATLSSKKHTWWGFWLAALSH